MPLKTKIQNVKMGVWASWWWKLILVATSRYKQGQKARTHRRTNTAFTNNSRFFLLIICEKQDHAIKIAKNTSCKSALMTLTTSPSSTVLWPADKETKGALTYFSSSLQPIVDTSARLSDIPFATGPHERVIECTGPSVHCKEFGGFFFLCS